MNESAVSLRIAALHQELLLGNAAALPAFWQEVIARGTPLIEPRADDPTHVLVTFLWRATSPISNVIVVGGLAGFANDVTRNQLRRLGDTDLWFKTYSAPSDLRMTYYLCVNDSLETTDDAWPDRIAIKQCDPLNPHVFPAESAGVAVIDSYVALPDAPPQPWVVPRHGAPRGALHQHTVSSAILKNEHVVWVYTPPRYNPAADPYGLLILFDGPEYTHLVPTPIILDNLLADALLPPLVAVLVGTPDRATRNREYRYHPPFVAFLAQELLPWLRRTYHLTTDPGLTVVGGSSGGGGIALFAALCHPELFGNVLSQAGAVAWRPEDDPEHEWLARQFATRPRLALRFHLDVGRYDRTVSPPDSPVDLLSANRHLRDVLQAKGYTVHYGEYNGSHDYACWRGTLCDGLLALLGSGRGLGRD